MDCTYKLQLVGEAVGKVIQENTGYIIGKANI